MNTIRNKFAAAVLTIGILSNTTSCTTVKNSTKTERGAVIGTAAGAVLGAVLGNNTGNGNNSELGAVLGAVIGGVAGGVIGKKMDDQVKEITTTLPGAEVKRVKEGIQVVLDETSSDGVRFSVNQATISSTSKSTLNKLATVFKNNPDTNIIIVGHTDSDGDQAYNQSLSVKRAAAVKSYLSSKGVSSFRLTTKGSGETNPAHTNRTAEGKAKNRRVEFFIAANKKMIQDAKKESN